MVINKLIILKEYSFQNDKRVFLFTCPYSYIVLSSSTSFIEKDNSELLREPRDSLEDLVKHK